MEQTGDAGSVGGEDARHVKYVRFSCSLHFAVSIFLLKNEGMCSANGTLGRLLLKPP